MMANTDQFQEPLCNLCVLFRNSHVLVEWDGRHWKERHEYGRYGSAFCRCEWGRKATLSNTARTFGKSEKPRLYLDANSSHAAAFPMNHPTESGRVWTKLRKVVSVEWSIGKAAACGLFASKYNLGFSDFPKVLAVLARTHIGHTRGFPSNLCHPIPPLRMNF